MVWYTKEETGHSIELGEGSCPSLVWCTSGSRNHAHEGKRYIILAEYSAELQATAEMCVPCQLNKPAYRGEPLLAHEVPAQRFSQVGSDDAAGQHASMTTMCCLKQRDCKCFCELNNCAAVIFMNQHLCRPGNVLGVAQPCVIDINPLYLKLRIISLILVLDNDILPAWYCVIFTILWWRNWTGYFSNKTPKIFWWGVMLQVNMHQLPQCIVASKLCFTLITAMLCCFKAPTHCHFVY